MKTKLITTTSLIIICASFLVLAVSCKKENEYDPLTTVTDIDGNVYHAVPIGTQVWLMENLQVTTLNDGTVITLISDPVTWSNLTSSGLCWYDNNNSNKSTYGGLYNWYVVNTGKLCPAGWHVPTQTEWMILVDLFGGIDRAGGKLKEMSTYQWLSPNIDATNESRFTALPGGARVGSNGFFMEIGTGAHFWSNTYFNEADALYFGLANTTGIVYSTNADKRNAFSVRCLKD